MQRTSNTKASWFALAAIALVSTAFFYGSVPSFSDSHGQAPVETNRHLSPSDLLW